MKKKNILAPYKGHWLITLFLAPFLVIAGWTFLNALLVFLGGNQGKEVIEDLIGGAIFTIIISVLLLAAHYAGVAQEREKALQQQFPNEPWKWRKQWQVNAIKSNSTWVFYLTAGFSIVFSIISIGAFPTFWRLIFEEGELVASLFLSFPVISLFALYKSYKMFLSWKRFKGASFVMDSLPAALGNVLKGQLVLDERPPAGSVFKVRLLHAKLETSGSGDNRRRRETMLWEDTQELPDYIGSYSGQYLLPIAFKLPEDAHGSDWFSSAIEYFWKLSVKADLPGPDYEQDFEVPVFDPEKYPFTSPDYLNEDGEIPSTIYQDPGDWKDANLIFTRTPNGNTYFCPPRRHKGIASLLTVVAFIFSAVPFVVIPATGWIIGTVFGLVFLLFGLVFLAMALSHWFGEIMLVTHKGRFSLQYGLFGRKQMTCNLDDIHELKIKSTMRSGQTAYYDIIAKLKNHQTVKLANYLEGKRDVLALRDRIASDIGFDMNDDQEI